MRPAILCQSKINYSHADIFMKTFDYGAEKKTPQTLKSSIDEVTDKMGILVFENITLHL